MDRPHGGGANGGTARERALQRLQRLLWASYGRCYDGLLDLVPYQRLLALAADRLGAENGHRVADLGCGTGNALSLIAAEHPEAELVGVDSSPVMLSHAQRKVAGATFHLADVLEWLDEQSADSFDRVLSVNVLYTMHAEQRRRFWADSLRLLAPSGRMVVVTTDRAGIGPVIREQTQHRSFLRTLTPRLTAVLLLNLVIWLLESRKVFDPASLEDLMSECELAGGSVVDWERCYGGPDEGVGVLLVVEPVVVLDEPEVDLRPERQEPAEQVGETADSSDTEHS